MKLQHPGIIKYIDHIITDDYVLLLTELHGTSWDASNPELNESTNPGLKSKAVENNGSQNSMISNRTSCDLFECIDARID